MLYAVYGCSSVGVCMYVPYDEQGGRCHKCHRHIFVHKPRRIHTRWLEKGGEIMFGRYYTFRVCERYVSGVQINSVISLHLSIYPAKGDAYRCMRFCVCSLRNSHTFSTSYLHRTAITDAEMTRGPT